MPNWTSEELERIEQTPELRIASLRADDTLRKSVTIWVVREGNDVYVRSVRGALGGWYQGVQDRHQGRIEAGGIERDVAFIEGADGADQGIDAAYRKKYSYSPSAVDHITSPEARATTLKVVPR